MNVIDVTELVRDAGQLGVVIYQERPIQVHASQRLPARASPEIVDRILSLLLDNVGRYIARALAREQGGELAAVDPHGTDDGARLELTLPLAENTQPL